MAGPYRPESAPGKRLVACWKLCFTIRIEDGTVVHGNETGLEIGSAVQPNLRALVNPITGRPYLPGSSIKGKLRSTLERVMTRADGKPGAAYDSAKGGPCGCGLHSCMACVIFGCGVPGKKESKSAPTRIIVRDAQLTEESKRFWDSAYREQRPQMEQKVESSTNRLTGAALNPRVGERLLPETEFQGEIVLRQFENDKQEKEDVEEFFDVIEKVMRFIEQTDGIGAGVSRGSGRISFPDLDTTKKVEVKAPEFKKRK